MADYGDEHRSTQPENHGFGNLPAVPPPGEWQAGYPPLPHDVAPFPHDVASPSPRSAQQTPYGPVPTGPSHSPSTSAAAIAALIAGFVGIILPVLGGLAAVVLGVVALIHIGRSNKTKTGWALASVGLCLGAMTTVGWVALFSSEDFRQGFEEGMQESNASQIVAIGDCLDMPLGVSDNFVVSEDDVVPCTTPHTAEYFGSAVLPESPEYPGEDEVFYQAVDECLDIFVDYTGTELVTHDDLDIFVEYPLSLHWRLNDREIACFVTEINGGVLTETVRS